MTSQIFEVAQLQQSLTCTASGAYYKAGQVYAAESQCIVYCSAMTLPLMILIFVYEGLCTCTAGCKTMNNRKGTACHAFDDDRDGVALPRNVRRNATECNCDVLARTVFALILGVLLAHPLASGLAS